MVEDNIPHSSTAISTIDQDQFNELLSGGDVNLPVNKEYFILFNFLTSKIRELEQRIEAGNL